MNILQKIKIWTRSLFKKEVVIKESIEKLLFDKYDRNTDENLLNPSFALEQRRIKNKKTLLRDEYNNYAFSKMKTYKDVHKDVTEEERIEKSKPKQGEIALYVNGNFTDLIKGEGFLSEEELIEKAIRNKSVVRKLCGSEVAEANYTPGKGVNIYSESYVEAMEQYEEFQL